jgi:hypothetical protein
MASKVKSDIKELKDFLEKEKEGFDTREASVINDNTQISIRIPQYYAKMFHLNGGEKFEFKAIREGKKIILTGRLKNGLD